MHNAYPFNTLEVGSRKSTKYYFKQASRDTYLYVRIKATKSCSAENIDFGNDSSFQINLTLEQSHLRSIYHVGYV